MKWQEVQRRLEQRYAQRNRRRTFSDQMSYGVGTRGMGYQRGGLRGVNVVRSYGQPQPKPLFSTMIPPPALPAPTKNQAPGVNNFFTVVTSH